MKSNFSQRKRKITASATSQLDETYDFKGLNLVAPDQAMPDGETPYTINSRRYARNETDTRVAIHSRLGSVVMSSAVGVTADDSNIATSTGDLLLEAGTTIAQQFTAGSNGVLSSLELEVKKATSGNGPIIIEIYTDNGGYPGSKVGQTSILPTDITNSYAYVAANLMDAPTMASGSDYWKVIYIQADGTGSYHLRQTAGSGLTKVEGDAGWSVLSSGFRFKTYFSTAAFIKGFTRRNPQNQDYKTVFAMGNDVYVVDDETPTPTSIDSNISSDSQKVRFAQVDNKTIWVDGENAARWWNGTDTPTQIVGVPGIPTNVLIYQNRALFVPKDDPTRVNFSELYNFESYRSVDFFYVPSPKSPDHIKAWHEFQDGVTIFTRKTKHIVFGSSLGTFTRKQAIGTKGAISQEATAADKNKIYFMAPDKLIYSWNGVEDTLISGKMEPEFQKIQDIEKVRLHLHRNQLRVYYNTKSDPTVNKMALFDIEQEQWFRDTGRCVMGSITWDMNDNELVEFSSRCGQLFFGETGYSDAGRAIEFKYWTAYKMYGSGIAKDRIRRFRPIVRPSDAPYTLKVGKDIDFQNKPTLRDFLVDSGGAKWGSFTWGDGTKWGGGEKVVDDKVAMSGRGKHTQFRFEHTSVSVPTWILGYAALVKSGRPR